MPLIYSVPRKAGFCLAFLLLVLSCFAAQAQLPSNCDLFPLNAPIPRARAFFGQRASISERFAIVGASSDPSGPALGSAHIYEYVGGVWIFRQTLSAPGTIPSDSYGNNVFIDENTALVAAYGYTRPGWSANHSGIVYVYTRQGTQWIQTGSFRNPGLTISAFGWSLAKSGSDVVVGCNYTGTQNHAAYVFRQPATPSQPWNLVATLRPQAGNTGYDYGYSVAIEGDNLVIGSLDAFSFGQSAAYFYHRNATGTWALAQVAAYPRGSRAGISVALHGKFAVVGSDSNLGVRIHELTTTGWQLRQTLFNPDTPLVSPGRYGYSVAINDDVLLVGNPSDNRTANVAGIVYRYDLRNGTWQLRRRYLAPQPQLSDGLGVCVAVDERSNNIIITGTGRTSLGVASAGQAFVEWGPAIVPAGPFCPGSPPFLLQATATGGLWSGPGIRNAQTGLFDPAQAGPGTHTITYDLTAGGCTYQDTQRITVNTQLRITNSRLPPLTCALDTTIIFSASLPGGTWSGTGIINSQTGSFRSVLAGPGRHVITYTIAGSNSCSTQDTVSVIVRPAKVRITTSSLRLSCARDTTFLLEATPRGGTWRGSGVSNSATGTFSSAAAGSGRHLLTYTFSGNGSCNSQDTLSIVVAPVKVRILSLETSLCRADTVLQLAAEPRGGVWRGTGITNAQLGVFAAATAGLGRHVLRYELGSGACRAVDSVAITIGPVPTPVLSPSDPLVLRCGQSSEVLSVASARPNGASYDWEYADFPTGIWQKLLNGNGQPTYAVTQPGYYRVNMMKGSCRATSAPTQVQVTPVQTVFIPNIFTPNADGLNDLFKLELQYPRTFQLRIFNRWGREIFSTNEYGNFWTGAEAAAGVYYYLWRYSTDCEPTEHVVKGTITLER